ncbi:MAG: DegV family protein [Chloroflexota bacterium]|nr:DegV family protein [Chloroflexota bacterium]MDE3192191.1 DegV family protein [Chloroflexota bacterium]
MSKGRFGILIDGTAAMPDDLVHAYDVRWLPMYVILKERSFLAGVQLSTADFYERIKAKDVVPETSQPTIQDCLDAYDASRRDGYRDLLVLTIATELSGTFSVATTSAQQTPSERGRIEVVDSRSLAGGISLIATAAARLRDRGGSFDDAVALARRMAGHISILAAADTLEYLRRSGRVSGGAALFGTLLAVKPILEVADGEVRPVDRVRTRDKAALRLRELIAQRTPDGARIHACALSTNDPERARTLGQWAQERYHCVEYFQAEAGPVIGARAGPGVIGLCWYAEEALG